VPDAGGPLCGNELDGPRPTSQVAVTFARDDGLLIGQRIETFASLRRHVTRA
jgi:hypothetical protein